MNELEERMTWAEYKSRAEGALLQMGAVLYVPNSCLTARATDLDAPACSAALPDTPQAGEKQTCQNCPSPVLTPMDRLSALCRHCRRMAEADE